VVPKAASSLLPPVFSYAQARRAGYSKHEIYRLRDSGRIEVISRGVYRRSKTPLLEEDLAEVAVKAPRATLCLASALVRHDLTDEIPARTDIALPRRTRAPSVLAPVRWHHFEVDTFDIGRTLLTLEGHTAIGLYSAERSIIDAFRLRGTEGHELAHIALKRWLRKPGHHPAALLRVAKHFPRTLTPLRKALELLL
jgi:hypothetical protein